MSKRMKLTNITPLISGYEVNIEDLLYKEEDCFGKVLKEMRISVTFYCDEKGDPTQVECKNPFFVMGSGFFVERFGKSQTRLIEKICRKSTKNAFEKINKLLEGVSLVK